MKDVGLTGPWPAENTVFEVTGLDLALLPGAHPFYLAHTQEIAENWQLESSANRHLFNGELVLQRWLSFRDGVIRGEAHIVPYSTLLWWRKQSAPVGAAHLFAFAVLVSSDGAIIAIVMSERTANPGKVYCAAGSIDRSDVIGDRLDVAGNMRREVFEETGLNLAEARAEDALYASHSRSRVVLFRFHHFGLTAEEMLARITAYMVHDTEKEIDGALAIRSADPSAHRYNSEMLPILDLFFGRDKV